MDDVGVKCGEPLFIEEIVENGSPENMSGMSVRVTGKLEDHSPEACTAVLMDPSSRKKLDINTLLIEPFPGRRGSLTQVIGELEYVTEKSAVVLKARVVRCVDGMDTALYRKALECQRTYLQSR